MKEVSHPCVPPISHAHGGGLPVSLNPQASEFIPSKKGESPGRASATPARAPAAPAPAAAAAITASAAVVATTRKVSSSRQDCRRDPLAPAGKLSKERRSSAGEKHIRHHDGVERPPSRNGELHVLHGATAVVNDSATTAVTMRAVVGTRVNSTRIHSSSTRSGSTRCANSVTSANASLGTDARSVALEKPERKRAGRNSHRNKHGSSEGVVPKKAGGGGTHQGRRNGGPGWIMGGNGGISPPCSAYSSSTPPTTLVAAATVPQRRPSSSSCGRRRSAASRCVYRRISWWPRGTSIAEALRRIGYAPSRVSSFGFVYVRPSGIVATCFDAIHPRVFFLKYEMIYTYWYVV